MKERNAMRQDMHVPANASAGAPEVDEDDEDFRRSLGILVRRGAYVGLTFKRRTRPNGVR
jgi:hypothetical protein